MIKNYHQLVKVNHNPNKAYIPDHPYRIVIIGGSGTGKTNVLLNLIKNKRPGIYKIYLCVKDPFKWRYQLLINGSESIGIKKSKKSKVFINCLKTFNDVYENLEDYNPTKKKTVLIGFGDMIKNMESN